MILFIPTGSSHSDDGAATGKHDLMRLIKLTLTPVLIILFKMGSCLSCILGDSEEASSPNSSNSRSPTTGRPSSRSPNKFISSSSAKGRPAGGSQPNPKAKLKSDRIDALIEKQASEQSNIVKILLLGKALIL